MECDLHEPEDIQLLLERKDRGAYDTRRLNSNWRRCLLSGCTFLTHFLFSAIQKVSVAGQCGNAMAVMGSA